MLILKLKYQNCSEQFINLFYTITLEEKLSFPITLSNCKQHFLIAKIDSK
jgi:hypothetical protein